MPWIALTRLGCHVIATARSTEKIHELEVMGMSAVALDVTNRESIAACKEQVTKICDGRLDILVNNA